MFGDSIVILRIEIPEQAVSNVYVRENLLCTASPVFKAALQGGFEETTIDKMETLSIKKCKICLALQTADTKVAHV